MSLMYCIRKIGIQTNNEEENNETFTYKKKKYKKLLDFDFEELVLDVASNHDFYIREITSVEDGNIKYLCLFLMPGVIPSNKWESRLKLLFLCFDFDSDSNLFKNPTQNSIEYTNSYSQRHKVTTVLYNLLRNEHDNDILCDQVSAAINHDLLKPKLRPYQEKAVRWLLHREIAKENIQPEYVEMLCREFPDQKFYINSVLTLTDRPENVQLPTGGILADEMGLGKTIEMLALILMNRRNITETSTNLDDCTLRKKMRENFEVSCICSKKQDKQIKCKKCYTMQHISCTRKYSKQHHYEEDYLCPICWDEEPLTESGATIIVSPVTIKMQWYTEIKNHTSIPISVFVYDGVSNSGWISPVELAEYDVVLTDYNVLSKEIHYSSQNGFTCALRGTRKYMRKTSPLTMVHWWRVLLDEAQMVESATRQASKMVKNLPTIHRWAVTGTPVQKTIDDIRGILEFLGSYPYYDKKMWKHMSLLFKRGDTRLLLDILGKLMWRTCKSTILDELGIPPQTEEVHYIIMTDVQKLFYLGQHRDYAFKFEENSSKFLETSMSINEIDPATLKSLLEPLRKLRQDCTVPAISQKSDQTVVKKFLQPHELLEHLKSTNEIDCKSQLRAIASSLNGMAGLHIIKKEYGKALELYDTVLDWSKKYTGAICVDSLLQIHALYNIITTLDIYSPSDSKTLYQKNDYISMHNVLDWKYLSTYYNNYTKAVENVNSVQESLSPLITKLHSKSQKYVLNILYIIEKHAHSEQLLNKINEEKRMNYIETLYPNFTMVQGVGYTVTVWMEKVFNARDEVLKEFGRFEKFTTYVRPKSENNKAEQEIVEKFVKAAFDCHLNLEEKKSKKKNEVKHCDLCEVQQALTSYECVIFNKVLDEKNNVTEGTWNPTYQETILKTIYAFAKNKYDQNHDIENIGKFLQMIEAMKKEYKELVKFWIEIEYTAKAYDELDMCKMRLEAVDPEEFRDMENKSIYKIPITEIASNMENLKYELITAEREFSKKLARLNYIKHLEKNTDPGICPICNHNPDSKYCVLECGHHMCMMCLVGMAHYQRNILTCAICRSRQKYEDVYYVTRQAVSNDTEVIKGNYSSKVEEIVRTVLQLKKKEKDVKIIIFSHWEPILKVIAGALTCNDITCKFKAPVKSINEFKDPSKDVTCLLLVLAQGSKGLNLIEATHVFLVEPILDPGEEQQAIGRVHRIGQTRPTTVHRFIVKETIEEKIYYTISNDTQGKWENKDITINNLKVLFSFD